VTEGTNRLIKPGEIVEASKGKWEEGSGKRAAPVIERWDGNAGERIAEVLCEGKRFE
jgi:hypothetical protein